MGATLFRFESCRAHHVKLKQVPEQRSLDVFVGGCSGGPDFAEVPEIERQRSDGRGEGAR